MLQHNINLYYYNKLQHNIKLKCCRFNENSHFEQVEKDVRRSDDARYLRHTFYYSVKMKLGPEIRI